MIYFKTIFITMNLDSYWIELPNLYIQLKNGQTKKIMGSVETAPHHQQQQPSIATSKEQHYNSRTSDWNY